MVEKVNFEFWFFCLTASNFKVFLRFYPTDSSLDSEWFSVFGCYLDVTWLQNLQFKWKISRSFCDRNIDRLEPI